LFSSCFGSCIGFLGPGGATLHHGGRGVHLARDKTLGTAETAEEHRAQGPETQPGEQKRVRDVVLSPSPIVPQPCSGKHAGGHVHGLGGGLLREELTEVVCFGGCNIKRGTDFKIGFALLPLLRWWDSARIRI